MPPEKWLVTATPPTPNGDLHLGHLSGPYLAADVTARHLRRRGADVVAMTGIDDHQSYTDTQAARVGTDAPTTARWFGDRIVRAWSQAGLRFDVIGRPDRMPYHRELTRQVFQALLDQGDIVPRVRPLPYCTQCRRWAFEAYVAGGCPHCGTAACGNACEVCGRPNDCADLTDPHCTACGTPCELRDCERLYFPLARHEQTLRRFWADVRMNGHLTALCDEMTAAGLPEIAVSHPADWGIEVPDPRFAGHRIYVWFEMAAGYLAAGADRPGTGVWSADRRVAQFFGYDNGYFHALLFPAVMRAFDPALPLPTDFVSNEFYRLDGAKFSTSRRHAIWLLDALRTEPADHLRLYLSWDRPTTEQTNFTWEGFRALLHEDLLPRWHGWLAALSRRCETALAGPDDAAAPAYSGPDDDAAPPCPSATAGADQTVRRLLRRTGETLRTVDEAYSVEDFSPRTALHQLDLLVHTAAETGGDLARLAGRPGRHDAFVRGVRAELTAAAALAVGLYPVAPDMAGQLWSALGRPGSVEQTWCDVSGLAADVEVKVGDLAAACPLFTPGRGRADT